MMPSLKVLYLRVKWKQWGSRRFNFSQFRPLHRPPRGEPVRVLAVLHHPLSLVPPLPAPELPPLAPPPPRPLSHLSKLVSPPRSRLYARSFGGDLTLSSKVGEGTEAILRLSRRGTGMEPVIWAHASSPAAHEEV